MVPPWKTRAMLDRYRVVHNRDRQLAAVAERDKYVAAEAAKPKVYDMIKQRKVGGKR